MIFIPKKEECASWNETKDGIYILYFVDNNKDKELSIEFLWSKCPETNYDPFYLSVIECMNDVVLNCPLNACSSKPQLRYNKIINKWFCNCPSSAISTKNDDEDEIDSNLINGSLTAERGYCDNPIEAILRWNESCAKDYKSIVKANLKKLKEIIKNE